MKRRFSTARTMQNSKRGFMRCDVDHLLRMWGAAHPPAPASAVAQGYGPGQAREYIEEKHRARRSERALPEYRLTGHTSLFGGPDTNLSDEYFAYKKMADRYGITGIRYASEPEEMQKSYYVAPTEEERAGGGCLSDKWSAMSGADFSDVASAPGAKGQRDRITYMPKYFRRTCRPVPFSGVHCFISSFEEEKRHADQLNAKYPRARKFARDIQLELVSGTFFEKPKKKKGQPVKRELGFWTVEETIDDVRRTSVQFPDSKTDTGYETAQTLPEREALAAGMIEIARKYRAAGDIVREIMEGVFRIIDGRP